MRIIIAVLLAIASPIAILGAQVKGRSHTGSLELPKKPEIFLEIPSKSPYTTSSETLRVSVGVKSVKSADSVTLRTAQAEFVPIFAANPKGGFLNVEWNLALSKGENTFDVVAGNEQGEVSQRLMVYYLPLPQITVMLPRESVVKTIIDSLDVIAEVGEITGPEKVTLRMSQGRTVPSTKTELLRGQFVLTWRVPLSKGQNEIEIVASNQQGSSKKTIGVQYEPSALPLPRIALMLPETTAVKTTSGNMQVVARIGEITGPEKAMLRLSENRAVPSIKTELLRGEFVLTWNVSLSKGPNEIEIVATNQQGSSRDTIRVQYEPSLAEGLTPIEYGGTFHAVLFGTDAYDNWKQLINPVTDVRTIAKELQDSYGYQVKVVENPTQSDLLTTLRSYAERKYGEDDQLLIFIAGHGEFDDVLGDGYIVTRDSKLKDEIKTSYVSHSNLRTVINSIPCRHIFLMVDACFGGTFDPLIAANERGRDEYAEASRTEFIKRKMRFKTRKFMTSGGKEYVPDGRPGQHSPFARKFLEALRSYGGKDGILTLTEIMTFIEKVVPEPRAGEFGTNEPGSDFIFIAR